MTYDRLSDFVSELEDEGDLIRITVEVDPVFEIAEIADRICKSTDGGPALFFERVGGSAMPVVVNLLGSERRMCKVLRADSFEEVAIRIAGLIKPELPEGWIDSLKLVPHFAPLTNLAPRIVKSGGCQQVVNLGSDVNLRTLPITHNWPGDAAPAITMGQFYTQNPVNETRNVGMYPLEVRDRSSLFVHWNPHQDGWRNFTAHQELDRQMPIAVALGGDPVFAYMANAPLPPDVDECLLGGFLRDANIELVKCRSNELAVPAECEIVIEGYVDVKAALETAGPIGGPTGFYGAREELPVMQVTAITHRANPLFPAMIPGKPPMEDYWINKATARIFLPLVKLFVPEIVDLHQPRAGIFRNFTFVSIRKQYPQQARKVMNALWSCGRLMTSKFIVVVDADVNVQDEEQVWFTVGANVHPGRDTVFSEGPTHMLDHAAPVRGLGHKLGLDATRKSPAEGHPQPWPEQLETSRQIQDMVTKRWEEYGLPKL